MLRPKVIAANSALDNIYIDDIFSTYLHVGSASPQTITNNINLDSEGGMVWIKGIQLAQPHYIFDTDRGALNEINSSTADAQASYANSLTSFNSDGFSIGPATGIGAGNINSKYVSWTFRRSPRFFDVVTYTGTGTNRTIAHNLQAVPGFILIKRTDTTSDWQVYHNSIASTEYLMLNSNAAKATGADRWNSTSPTNSVFSLGTNIAVNAAGGTYVAYLFAHDSDPSGVISCGSYAGNSSSNGPVINLGWEPQWLLIKDVTALGDWTLVDTMRGFGTKEANWGPDPDAVMRLHLSNGQALIVGPSPRSTGFILNMSAAATFNTTGRTYAYVAIRRPNKPPASASEVFVPVFTTSTTVTTGFPPDVVWCKNTSIIQPWYGQDRLRGLISVSGDGLIYYPASGPPSSTYRFIRMDTSTYFTEVEGSTTPDLYLNFRRAPGFLDMVPYKGSNGTPQTIPHNLNAKPEFMITGRQDAGATYIYHKDTGISFVFAFNSNPASSGAGALWNNTEPSATTFSVAGFNTTQTSYYIWMGFATLPGISKVGSYIGTGTTQQIDCGFTNGARFVLIKNAGLIASASSNGTGPWYLWTSATGITTGNDPYVLFQLQSNAAVTNTDYIDPYSAGFEISSTAPADLNVAGNRFIYLAIA